MEIDDFVVVAMEIDKLFARFRILHQIKQLPRGL